MQIGCIESFLLCFENKLKQVNPMPDFTKNSTPKEHPPRENVLIIHYDPGWLKIHLQIILDFCNLYFARTKQEAIARLSEVKDIRLVISDLSMLTSDNYRLLKFLKLNDAYRHIPIINLIPLSEDAGKFTTFSSSVRDFSLQQLQAEEFVALVRELLSGNTQAEPAYNGARSAYASGRILSPNDILWMQQLESIVLLHLSDPSYKVSQLAYDLHLSSSSFARKIRNLLGVNPGQYFTQVRMQQAKHFLENRYYPSVSHVSSAVGFKHPGAFSRCFHKYFDIAPSEMVR